MNFIRRTLVYYLRFFPREGVTSTYISVNVSMNYTANLVSAVARTFQLVFILKCIPFMHGAARAGKDEGPRGRGSGWGEVRVHPVTLALPPPSPLSPYVWWNCHYATHATQYVLAYMHRLVVFHGEERQFCPSSVVSLLSSPLLG